MAINRTITGVRKAEVTAENYSYPLLIRQLLHSVLSTDRDQEIVYRDRVRLTYAQWHQRLKRLANALTGLGVAPGETVAMLDWDSHRYLEAYFAVPMMGAVLQTVNVRLTPEEIRYTLDHANAEIVIFHRDFLPLIERLRVVLPKVKAFVLIAEDGAPEVEWSAGEYEQLLGDASPEYDFPEFDENAIATTFYTTGTTGLPKAVSFTHRQLVLHTVTLMGALANLGNTRSFTRNDVYMPLTPMFHVHAWGVPYLAVLLGIKQVYPGRYDPLTILKLGKAEGVSFSHCVPTILQMLLHVEGGAAIEVKDWKLIIGGAALPAALCKAGLDRGFDVCSGYGMSETAPFLTITRWSDALQPSPAEELDIRCRTGLPAPLVELRVVDENMQDVPPDGRSVGEIIVRTPWLTSAYRGDPDASAQLWRGGYLHTQDVATIDAKGYVQVRDRLKDVIKSGGEWISSLRLEDYISRHPGVMEAAVIAISDELWGERPLAVLVPRAGWENKLTLQAISEHLESFVSADLLPRMALPKRVEEVAALDRSSVGKVDKKALRARYAQK